MPLVRFVRHAQSENNLSVAQLQEREWESPAQMQAAVERARKPDPSLSALGEAQLPHLAARLAELAARPSTLLVTSPMRRAIATALPIAAAAGLDYLTCEGELYEVGGAHYCGHARASATADELEAEFPLRCQNFPDGGWYAGHTHAETDMQAHARVSRLIAWAETTLAGGAFEELIIIAHGDLLSRWLRRWLGVPWGRDLAIVHGNTGITTLAWDARRGLQLRGLNDVSHLPEELRSGAQHEFWWRYTLPDLELRRYQGWADIPDALAKEVASMRERLLLEPDGKRIEDCAPSDARSLHVIAIAEGELAGCVQYDPEGGRLRQLAVRERARGCGLGRRLVREAEDECLRQGRASLLVHAWVESQAFYAALGFEPFAAPQAKEAGMREWIAMRKPVERS